MKQELLSARSKIKSKGFLIESVSTIIKFDRFEDEVFPGIDSHTRRKCEEN
jgi:hypothetical protein